MPYYATATPGAARPNQPNSPNTADNAPALPNAPNSANDYVPQHVQENTPGAPVTPGTPNTPNAPNTPNDYQAPKLPSPAAPNQPNQPNAPNTPNTPNASVSQENVPVSANAPNQPNKPNTANVPAISQGDAASQNVQESEATTGQSREVSGLRASRSQQSETSVPQPLPSGDSPNGGGGLGIILGAVLLLTAAGFLAWKRKQKTVSKPKAGPDAAPTSDQDSSETSPREP